MKTAVRSGQIRTSLLFVALLALLAVAVGPGNSDAQGARASIVNGKATTIRDWPWQVAIAIGTDARPRLAPRRRTFCGGSLIAPDLVITAGHCVADVSRRNIRRTDVITGRTYLNRKSSGEEVGVKRRFMPTYKSGRRKFRSFAGAADWDVALLKLDHPVAGPSIKLAGGDERAAWRTGQIVKTTGWGVTSSAQRKAENGMRLATQVMQPEKICRRFNGEAFNQRQMVCFGAASIHASPCEGDSGGPLMARVDTGKGREFRLVGLTSWGDGNCRGFIPSVDTRVADQPLRGWVKRTAKRVTGIDVVGHGGESAEPRDWCRVPNLHGLSLASARKKLVAHNCRLGRSVADRHARGRSGTVTGASYFAGWRAKPGARIRVGLVP